MKIIKLTESDMETIVNRVLKEENNSLPEEVESTAKELVGKTLRLVTPNLEFKKDLTGIYEIIKTIPTNKGGLSGQFNLLSLSLNLKRVADIQTKDVNDNRIFYIKGTCFGELFKWDAKIGVNTNGTYSDLPVRISKKLADHLYNNWCSLYTEEDRKSAGADFD